MKNKILILGASGMLGSAISKRLIDTESIIYIYYRTDERFNEFFKGAIKVDIPNLDKENLNSFFRELKPDFVINCIGLIKQRKESEDHVQSIEINSLLPHLLSSLSGIYNFKLIHFSTDCVFQGKHGFYKENSLKDANDLYGLSKSLGEIAYCKNTITLRTSIIGRELKGHKSLMDWFLTNPEKEITGYDRAIFSGLTTHEVANVVLIIIRQFKPGLFNLSSDPIDKFNLLLILNDIWKMEKKIIPNSELKVDKSLDSSKFKNLFNYQPPSWRKQISSSYEFYKRYY